MLQQKQLSCRQLCHIISKPEEDRLHHVSIRLNIQTVSFRVILNHIMLTLDQSFFRDILEQKFVVEFDLISNHVYLVQ
jgi:hypothetical protein